jgi:hypothetical protein
VSDAKPPGPKQVWLRALVAFPAIPLAYLVTLRVLRPARATVREAAKTPSGAQVLTLRPGLEQTSRVEAYRAAGRNGRI